MIWLQNPELVPHLLTLTTSLSVSHLGRDKFSAEQTTKGQYLGKEGRSEEKEQPGRGQSKAIKPSLYLCLYHVVPGATLTWEFSHTSWTGTGKANYSPQFQQHQENMWVFYLVLEL